MSPTADTSAHTDQAGSVEVSGQGLQLVGGLAYYSAHQVQATLTPKAAAAAITRAMLEGLDPAEDIARSAVELEAGQMLLMPTQTSRCVGLKVANVAPGNPARGLARIQALYVLMQADTLTPLALMDGTALTSLRTPAVSIAATERALRALPGPVEAVIFGAGPQAVGHVQALEQVDGLQLAKVTYVVRRPAAVALPGGATPSRLLAAGDAAVSQALRDARVVVCATSAHDPVLDADDVVEGTVVIAVGSHEPEVRELPGALMARATVVVEDPGAALREAGDVVLAVAEGHLRPEELVTMRAVARGEVEVPANRVVVFKSVGMSWQDLVIAEQVAAPLLAADAHS